MAEPVALEDLAAHCLARMDQEGEAALDALCAAHPLQARALRKVIGRLSRVGLTQAWPAAGGDLRELGEYRILRRLGSGGMGVVYLAEQPRLGRKVALKVLRPGTLLEPRARERFRREVEALSRLDHPNVGTVYDAGEIEGTPYLAMRPVDGPSLAELLDRARRDRTKEPRANTTVTGSRDALLAMLEKVARALHAAHEAGVVHRDVKPGNVLIDRDGEPIVVDFGLVRAEGEGAALTETGDQLGTPSYMAPEQIEPSVGAIDRRTDVYALGVLAYECLTLQLPYEAATRDALYRRILDGDAPEPRARDRRIVLELSVVVRRAIDRDPARRFATAAELADELERVRMHRPIASRRPAVHRRVLQWCLRNRVAAVFLATLSVGLAASLVLLVALSNALARADAALTVNTIRELAASSPEQAFVAARQLLRRDPTPEHASLVQELMGKLHAEAVVSLGDDVRVHAMALSPDGRSFAVADGERRVRLGRFDATAPSVVGPWRTPGALTFDEEGRQLAVGTVAAGVRVLALGEEHSEHRLPTGDAPTLSPGFVSLSWRAGRLLAVHGRHGWHVWDQAGQRLRVGSLDDFNPMIGVLSPDGRHAVLGETVQPGAPSRIVIHDLDGDRLHVIDGLVGHCSSLAVTRQRLAGANSGQLVIANLDGSIVKLVAEEDREFLSVAFDTTGTRLLAGDSAGRIRLLTSDGGILDGRDVPGSVSRVAFSADSARIATAGWDHTVRVFDVAGDRLVEQAVLVGHRNGVSCVAFDPTDRDRVISSSWDGTVRAWCLRPVSVRTGDGSVAAVSYVVGDAGGRVVGIMAQGDLRVWDARLQPLASLDVRAELGTGWLTHPMMSADGEEMALGTSYGPCLAWRWQDEPRPIALPARPQRPALGVVPLGQGRYATIVYGPGGAMLATARPGDERWTRWRQLPGVHFAQVMSFAFAPALDRLVTVDGELTPRIWQVGEGEPKVVATLPRRSGGHAVFARDGQTLFLGSEEGIVRRWDLRDVAGPRPLDLRGHAGNVRTLALSPDERRLLTGSSDKTLRVWDATTGVLLMVLRGHQRNVTGCCFTQDGQRALSASSDGTIREWWLTVEDIQRAAAAVHVPGM